MLFFRFLMNVCSYVYRYAHIQYILVILISVRMMITPSTCLLVAYVCVAVRRRAYLARDQLLDSLLLLLLLLLRVPQFRSPLTSDRQQGHRRVKQSNGRRRRQIAAATRSFSGQRRTGRRRRGTKLIDWLADWVDGW